MSDQSFSCLHTNSKAPEEAKEFGQSLQKLQFGLGYLHVHEP